jgi:hypothetical protein
VVTLVDAEQGLAALEQEVAVAQVREGEGKKGGGEQAGFTGAGGRGEYTGLL